MDLIATALGEPTTWTPTLAKRLGRGRRAPPRSLAKALGPNEPILHLRSGVPMANVELRSSRGLARDSARYRSSLARRAPVTLPDLGVAATFPGV